MEVFEIQPVILGGSPIDPANKTPLDGNRPGSLRKEAGAPDSICEREVLGR
jgi:hypothetical protein